MAVNTDLGSLADILVYRLSSGPCSVHLDSADTPAPWGFVGKGESPIPGNGQACSTTKVWHPETAFRLPCAPPTLPPHPAGRTLLRSAGALLVKLSPAGQHRTQCTEHTHVSPFFSTLPAPNPFSPLAAFSWITGWAPCCLPASSLPHPLPGKAFCHVQCPASKSSVPPASCPSQGKSYPRRTPHLLIWTPPATLPSLPPFSLDPPPRPCRPASASRPQFWKLRAPLRLKGSAPAAPPGALTFPLLSRHCVTAPPPLSRSTSPPLGRLLCLPPTPRSGPESSLGSHDPLHLPHGQSVCVSDSHHAGPCFQFTAGHRANNSLWVNEGTGSAPRCAAPWVSAGSSGEYSPVLARRTLQ